MAGLLQHRRQIPSKSTPCEWSNLSGVLRSMAVGKLSVSGHIQSDAVRFGPCLRVVITPLSSRRRHVVVPSAPLNGSVADPSLRASADAKNHTAPVAVASGVSGHGPRISLKAVT